MKHSPILQTRDLAQAPPLGAKLRNKYGFTATVDDIFMGTGHTAMILKWQDQDGRKRGQVWTCRDWCERWEVQR